RRGARRQRGRRRHGLAPPVARPLPAGRPAAGGRSRPPRRGPNPHAGPAWARTPGRRCRRQGSRRLALGGRDLGRARAARADVVHLALAAALVHLPLLGTVTGGQLLQHLLVAAGQQQARAVGLQPLQAAVHVPGLLLHRAFQAVEEGAAVGQLGRADGRQLAGGVLLGIAAQLVQPRLLQLVGALALGQLAGHGILVLLRAAQQRIDAAGLHHAACSSWCSRSATAWRLWSRSAERATSWPRNSTISGQRSRASSTAGSLPGW